MAIVAGVVAEMNNVGNYQWDESYPDRARFARDVDNGSLYVAEDAGLVVGFVTVDEVEPDGYQGLPWTPSVGFLVIHRFAVDGHQRSKGVATVLEEFACRMAARCAISELRVDTYSTNHTMQAFLSKKGYNKVGEMEFRGKPLPFYCYEKLL